MSEITEDFCLHVSADIRSRLLQSVMKNEGSKWLAKMYNKDREAFVFNSVFVYDDLADVMLKNQPTMHIDIRTPTLTQKAIEDIMASIYKKLITRKDIEVVPKLEIQWEILIEELINRFIDHVFKDDGLVRYITTMHLVDSMVDKVEIKNYVLYNDLPLMDIGDDMKDRRTVEKALLKYQRDYEKYKDNPTLSQKFKLKIDELTSELDDHYND